METIQSLPGISSSSSSVCMMTSVANHRPLTESTANGSPGAQNERQASRGTSTMDPELRRDELNFGVVVEGRIYRSAFPQPQFLEAFKSLRLKTIITLVDEPYTASHTKFLGNKIKHFRKPIEANKPAAKDDTATRASDSTVNEILEILSNPANHPVLVHCNRGKHRTGCVMGCFRKLLGWDLCDVLSEYRKYSAPKSRALDEKFIEEFDADASRLVVSAHFSDADAALWQSSNPLEQKERKDEPPRHLIPAPYGVKVS